MQELILANAVSVQDGQPVTTSLKVAEIFGKKAKDINKSISRLIEQDERCKRNFAPTSFPVQMPNGGVRAETAYLMTRDGFTLLAMGFTGKTALSFKLAYIEAFNRMEAELRSRNVRDDAKRYLDFCFAEFRGQMELSLDAMLGERTRMPNGFIPPTVEEVRAYVEAEGFTNIDPERFVNYYNARNWTMNSYRTPVTDWKEGVRAWNNLDNSRHTLSPGNPLPLPAPSPRRSRATRNSRRAR